MTAAPQDMDDLLLALYRLSHELPVDAFQDAALRLIKPVLPFESSMWGTATGTDQGIDVHTLHLHEKSAEMMAEYEAVKHLDTAAASLLTRRRGTLGINAVAHSPAPEQRVLVDYLQRWEQNNIFITGDHDPQTRFVHWVSLFRADPDAHCRPEEVRLLERIAPHLMQALAMNRVMHLGRQTPGAHLGLGAAIADLRGVVYHADSGFEELLRNEWPGWHGGTLPHALLQHFLTGHDRHVGGTVAVSHHVEKGLLFMRARPRCRVDSLTPRELTVARLVGRGSTYKEIAQLLGRSPATVRNHIQSIYEKLAVSNVAMLIDELRQAE